ncbi:MAG: mercury resistance system transport protein MerF [Alphaproteobacteria bacterium]
MSNKRLLFVGIGGSLLAALCCFTPVLVLGLTIVGLSAWLGWLDFVLFPALGFFVLLTAYALYRQHRQSKATQTVSSAQSIAQSGAGS